MKRPNLKFFRLAIYIIAFLIFLFFAGRAIRSNAKRMEEATEQDLPSRFHLTNEEIDLLTPEFRSRLSANKIYLNKSRSPIALLFYDGKYDLITYRFAQGLGGSLKDILQVQYKGAREQVGVVYQVIDDDLYFSFLKKDSRTSIVRNLWLTIDGDSVANPILNDSIA